jgi:hypothetical protein
MRLIKQNIERDGSGTITLFPEEPEDMVRAIALSFDLSSPLTSAVACLQSHRTQRSAPRISHPQSDY